MRQAFKPLLRNVAAVADHSHLKRPAAVTGTPGFSFRSKYDVTFIHTVPRDCCYH